MLDEANIGSNTCCRDIILVGRFIPARPLFLFITFTLNIISSLLLVLLFEDETRETIENLLTDYMAEHGPNFLKSEVQKAIHQKHEKVQDPMKYYLMTKAYLF